MKKLSVVLCGILVLAMGGTALAGEMKPSVCLGGQMGMPMNDFGDVWKMGFGGNGRFGMQFSPKFEAGLTVGYNPLPLDEEGTRDVFLGSSKQLFELAGGDLTIGGGDMTMFEVLADFRFFIPVGAEGAPFKPYLTGAVGVSSVSVDDLEYELTLTGLLDTTLSEPIESKTVAVFGLGAGFEYMFTRKSGSGWTASICCPR